MLNRVVFRSVAVLTALGVAAPAFGWGPQGHRVIAEAAEVRLTPSARLAIRDLLHSGDTLAGVANWADKEGHDAVPGSAPWHYINVPITESRFQPGEVHGSDNVVAKIEHYRKVLGDRSASKQDRQRALLFLVHLVADIHQPLHVGDNGDRGGNSTQVQFYNEGTNLHRVWDSDLIHKIGGNDQAWVGRLERASTPEAIRDWSKGTVNDWANESLQAAKLAYRDPADAPKPFSSGVTLGDRYVRRSEPIVVEQMARASIRLANELNAIFR